MVSTDPSFRWNRAVVVILLPKSLLCIRHCRRCFFIAVTGQSAFPLTSTTGFASKLRLCPVFVFLIFSAYPYSVHSTSLTVVSVVASNPHRVFGLRSFPLLTVKKYVVSATHTRIVPSLSRMAISLLAHGMVMSSCCFACLLRLASDLCPSSYRSNTLRICSRCCCSSQGQSCLLLLRVHVTQPSQQLPHQSPVLVVRHIYSARRV